MKDRKFAYFKRKILAHLESLERDRNRLKKSLLEMEKAGFPVGTIRVWKGKKYVKIAPGKWRPKYDSHTRGAKLSVAAIKRKAASCKTSQELLQLVLEHKSRFSDESGRPLPFVRELSEYVSSLNDKLEAGGVSAGKTARPPKPAASNKKPGDKAEAKKTASEKDVLAAYSKEYRKLYNSQEVPGQYAEANDRFDNLMKNNAAFKDYVVKLARIRQYAFSSDREVAALMAALEKTGKLAGLSGTGKKSNDTARKGALKVLNKQETHNFIEKHKNSKENERVSLGAISWEAKNRIKDKTGLNVERVILDSDSIRHTFNNPNHNLEPNDLDDMKDVIETSTDISLSSNKNAVGNPVIVFKKQEPNGVILCEEYRAKKKELELQTAYRIKKNRQPHGAEKQLPANVRNATAPRDKILQSGGSVNGNAAKNPGIAAIRAKYEAEKSVTGNKKTVTLPDGSKIKCHYKIVEAQAPSASHDEVTFAPTGGFPTNSGGKNINDRDYQHDRDAQESVRRIAADFNSLALQSPPVVTKDGIVISGNNRTMSSKLAARNGTDKAYLEDLREMADEFGLEASDLDGFRHPRLILEVDAEHEGAYTTEEFAAFNQNTKKTMNNIEKAVKITKTLDKEKITGIAHCLDGYETMGELYQDKKGGGKLVQELVKAGVILENEKAQYLTSDGLLNDTGKDFVETVLVGSVLSEENIRSCDSAGGKSIRKKLIRAILPLIENKGTGKEYSFNAELNEAVSIALAVSKHHDQFQNVQDYLAQGNLFDGEKPDAVTSRLAELIHDETEKAFAARMKGLSAGLRDSAEGLQDIFLEGVETKDALMRRFFEMKKALALAVKNALEKVFRESA